MSDQDGFENALQESILAGDWDGWLLQRSIYADFLKETNHPLQFWARAEVYRRIRHQNRRQNDDGVWVDAHEPSSWALHFEVSDESQKSPWQRFFKWLKSEDGYPTRTTDAAKLSTNYRRVLGFPATTLRLTRLINNCEEFFKFTFDMGGPKIEAWKMLKLAPNATTTERRKCGVYQAFDTSIHPLGYQALFVPFWWRAKTEAVQGSLFEPEDLQGADG